MADTLERGDTVTDEHALDAAEGNEVRLAAHRLEHIANAMDAHLAAGGAVSVSLTLTVTMDQHLLAEQLEVHRRGQDVDVQRAEGVAAEPRSSSGGSEEEASASAVPTVRGMPVVAPDAQRWNGYDDSGVEEPVAWMFTSQGDGRVVRV